MSEPSGLYRPPPVDEADLSVGKVIQCTVVRYEEADGAYMVDIGADRLAKLSSKDVALKANASSPRDGGQGFEELQPGAVYEGQILSAGEAGVTVSLAEVQRAVAWRRIGQLLQADVTYSSTVLRVAPAGATVDVEGLPAFLPWSHWHLGNKTPRRRELIGMTLPVKLLEADRARGRLVVSHRRYVLQGRLDELRPGNLVDGVVTSVKPYGAVVCLADGLDGLLHISQVSQIYVKDMASVTPVGEKVRCVVIKVEPKDGSINLSTKMLEAKPGDMVRDTAAVRERAAKLDAISMS